MPTYVMKNGRLEGTYTRRQRKGALFKDKEFLRLCEHKDYQRLIENYPVEAAQDNLSWRVISVLDLDKLEKP